MRPRRPGVNQFTKLEIHREYSWHQGQVTGQGVSLDGGQTLDDGGVKREQRVVMDSQQEPELRVSLHWHRETRGGHAGQPGHIAGGQPGLDVGVEEGEDVVEGGEQGLAGGAGVGLLSSHHGHLLPDAQPGAPGSRPPAM